MEKIEHGAEMFSLRRVTRKFVFISIGVLCLIGITTALCLVIFQRPKPPIQIKLSDGRILQIEGVTYGTHHRMGKKSPLVERFGQWLPNSVNKALGSEQIEDKIDLEHPALVVWVNALDAAGKTNVDCQGIRVEFVSKEGDLFGEETSHWIGHPNFYRVGHIFYCYPQDEHDLNWQVTSWKKFKGKKNEPVSAHFPNPHLVEPARWTGLPLPQSKTVGDIEIVLNKLMTQTNGQGKKSYYETPAQFFEPVWEFRQNDQPAHGWEKPEWIAEDAIGNRGQFLGIHSPTLKFFTTVYPKATNVAAASLIMSLPKFDLTALNTNLWWNRKARVDGNEITVLGFFPPGTHTFSEGIYESSSASILGPGGGEPSGWTGMSRRSNPFQVKNSHSHYTPQPTIYIHVPRLNEPNRLAVRLHDDDGQFWVAKPEPGGTVDGIYPFLVELPKTVTNVVVEVVLLKPMQADFLVRTISKE